MNAAKAVILILIGMTLYQGLIFIFEPSVNLDKKVLDIPLSNQIYLVGYRENSANATSGFRYDFYVVDKDQELTSPFLITSTPNVQIQPSSPTSFNVTVKGNIFKFTNVVWINNASGLIPISVALHATP